MSAFETWMETADNDCKRLGMRGAEKVWNAAIEYMVAQKLPTLEECELWYVKEKCGFEHITELEKNVIREVHGYICKQIQSSPF